MHDKKRHEITLIEVGITNQDLLHSVESEKLRRYNFLANELSLLYKCKTKIIPCVMTWDSILSSYHKEHVEKLGLTKNIEAYIQSKGLKKILKSISFD